MIKPFLQSMSRFQKEKPGLNVCIMLITCQPRLAAAYLRQQTNGSDNICKWINIFNLQTTC